MGEDVPQRDFVLAKAPKRRPVHGYWIVEIGPTALDLLQKRDRGERLRAGEEREQCIRANLMAALSVGEAADEIQDKPTPVVNGKRCPRVQSLWVELCLKEAFNLHQ
jgi:hypothetical protein